MLNQRKHISFLFWGLLYANLALFGITGYSQTKEADSLKEVALHVSRPEARLPALISYFDQWYNIQRDTLYYYAAEAWHLSNQSGKPQERAAAALALSRSYMHWGWTDSAIAFLKPYELYGDDKIPIRLVLEINRQLALAHGGVSRYQEALNVLYSNCRLAETRKDWVGFAASANTIISVLLSMRKPNDIPFWWQRARNALQSTPEKAWPVLAALYTNYGGYWLQVQFPQKAGHYLDSAWAVLRVHENLAVRPTLFRFKAQYFLASKRIDSAGAMLKEMIAARSLIAGNFSFIEETLEIASFYEQNGFVDEAISICERSIFQGDLLDSASQNQTFNNDIKNRLPYYSMLVRLYKKAGKKEKYTEALEWLVMAKDSLYNYNNAQAIAELQTKYELSEKERAIALQKVEIWRKNLLLFAGGGLAVLIMGGMLYGFVRYRKKQRLQMDAAMAAEKEKAEKARSEAAELERKRIAADLHDNLGAYGAAIRHNVSQIKKEDKPPESLLAQMESNVLHMTDELSNTIWVLNKSEQHITSLYDSIKNWTLRLLSNYPGIKCRFEEELEKDPVLTPQQSLQWLYILQEAINNAAKHSGTPILMVKLQEKQGWKVIVEDRGKGLGDGISEGQGLHTIKDRCVKMGWEANWLSVPDGGTRFELTGEPEKAA